MASSRCCLDVVCLFVCFQLPLVPFHSLFLSICLFSLSSNTQVQDFQLTNWKYRARNCEGFSIHIHAAFSSIRFIPLTSRMNSKLLFLCAKTESKNIPLCTSNWDNEVNDSHVVNIQWKVQYSFIFAISSIGSSNSCVVMHLIKFYLLRNKSKSLLDFLKGQTTSLSRRPTGNDVRW